MRVFRSIKVQRNILAVLIAVVFVYQCLSVFTMTDSWQAELRQNEHQFRLLMYTSNNSNLTVVQSSPKVEPVRVNNSNNEVTSLTVATVNASKSDTAQDSATATPVTRLPNSTQLNEAVAVAHSRGASQQQVVKSPVSAVSQGRKQVLQDNTITSNENIMKTGSLVPLQVVKGSQYLDERIKQLYLSCNPKVLRKNPDGHVFGQCKNITDMRFINGSRVVALPSYPGSGNTWTRMLLEQATGIFTGSIYCDKELKARGFFGEKLSSSNVLAVKTHYPNKELFVPYEEFRNPDKFKNVTAAIVIIRNPLDSLVSHWNWKHGGHVSQMKPALFGNNTKWKQFIKTGAEQAVGIVRYWLEEAQISVLVIRYEDMVTDLATQLTKMLDFLEVDYSQSDLDCVTDDTMEIFHRKKTVPAEFNPFVPSDKQFVWDKFMSVKHILDKYNIVYESRNI